jgi:hypothetical protein
MGSDTSNGRRLRMANGLEWAEQPTRDAELCDDPGEPVSGHADPQLSHVCSGTDDKRRICINGLVSTNGLWPAYTQECRCSCHREEEIIDCWCGEHKTVRSRTCLELECPHYEGDQCEC